LGENFQPMRTVEAVALVVYQHHMSIAESKTSRRVPCSVDKQQTTALGWQLTEILINQQFVCLSMQ